MGASYKATPSPNIITKKVLIIFENFSPMAPDIVEKYSPIKEGNDSTFYSSK
jgi:hypothetical protein